MPPSYTFFMPLLGKTTERHHVLVVRKHANGFGSAFAPPKTGAHAKVGWGLAPAIEGQGACETDVVRFNQRFLSISALIIYIFALYILS